MPGLSIIIINYKSWSVLEKCIKSIWSQKTKSIEIIIIDNNSNDNQIINFNLKNTNSLISLVKNKNYKSNKKLINLNIKNNKIFYSNSRYINGGIYKFKRKIFKYINKYNCSLENDVLPELIKSKKVSGKKFNKFFLIDVNFIKINF